MVRLVSRRDIDSGALQVIVDHHTRSEEHTSELQSHLNLVCRLLLAEKHTSVLQSHLNLLCRLLLEKNKEVDTSVIVGRRPCVLSRANPPCGPCRSVC